MRRTLLEIAALLVFVGVVIHPLRHCVVEPMRQSLLGRREAPGRRLAMASQFGFDTAAGNSVRIVPGAPSLDLADLPTEAVTLILGGFRGPYVVWLWMKVEDDMQKKVQFDLIDRVTKIAAFQPDYPEMWTFHAWNFAWNVSVQWQSPERKYQWIRRAIEFLREGNRRNPHSAEIMEALGWVYSEKLGRSAEALYYRQRVMEDEGRSTFLIAHEWYDRARKANDRYGTLGHGLSKPVSYSLACHSVSYHAIELTQDAYDAFRRSIETRVPGREAESRRAFEEGMQRLDEALGAWQWARREWYDQALRFEREGTTPSLIDNYRRFFGEAADSAAGLESFRDEVTYEDLPDVFDRLKRPEIR
jgi:hypothetical protein